MIDPLRFSHLSCRSEVETSLTVVSLKTTRFLDFGRNDKLVIRHSSEDGGQNALRRDPAARFATA